MLTLNKQVQLRVAYFVRKKRSFELRLLSIYILQPAETWNEKRNKQTR